MSWAREGWSKGDRPSLFPANQEREKLHEKECGHYIWNMESWPRVMILSSLTGLKGLIQGLYVRTYIEPKPPVIRDSDVNRPVGHPVDITT